MNIKKGLSISRGSSEGRKAIVPTIEFKPSFKELLSKNIGP